MKMPKFLLASLFLVASVQVYSYTWTVHNASNSSLKIEVCTTVGVDNCQTQDIQAGEQKDFAFTKWYNTGLCFGGIKVNGIKIQSYNQLFPGSLDHYGQQDYTCDDFKVTIESVNNLGIVYYYY